MTTENIIRVYKSARDHIIELDIDLSITRTNLNRKVVNKDYAKYRCDKAYVVKISNKITGNETDCIASDNNSVFQYKEGETVSERSYDDDIEIVCTKGIHFYLTKEAAYFHNFTSDETYTGVYKNWNDDGQLVLQINYTNGSINGLYEIWNNFGILWSVETYINGKREGECKKWYFNGKLYKEYTYKNDVKNGLYIKWYDNGQLQIEANYANGVLNGTYRSWNKNGAIIYNRTYKNGQRTDIIYEKFYNCGVAMLSGILSGMFLGIMFKVIKNNVFK